jgi:hypothetical protein
VQRSTNIKHLLADPLYVLFNSLLWVDGTAWLLYLLLICGFLGSAERWLGSLRWLVVGLTAHVVATYLSEGMLYLEIKDGVAPHRLVDVRDIGVSYFLVGVIGVLSYRIARPWRWGYLAIAFAILGEQAIVSPHFTQVGHLCALLIGLGCYPLTRWRDPARLDPVELVTRVRRRVVNTG